MRSGTGSTISLALLLSGCLAGPADRLAALYPDAIPEAVERFERVEGPVSRRCAVELHRAHIEIAPAERVETKCRGAGISGCVDWWADWLGASPRYYVVVRDWEHTEATIQHELGHALYHCPHIGERPFPHDAWDDGHDRAYWSALGMDLRAQLSP